MENREIYAPWKPPFRYEDFGTQIVDSGGQKILDMRGWGFLTGQGSLAMDSAKAEEIQIRIGNRVAELMNEDAKE